MTQAEVEDQLIEQMRDRAKGLAILIFTSVWLLWIGRQTEFLHSQLPGIVDPDVVIREETEDAENAQGRQLSIRLGKKMVWSILTTELAEFARSF